MLETHRSVMELWIKGDFYVSFDQPETDGSDLLNIPRPLWEDMGSPQTITLTVEPGDKLNGGE